jgi:hypothetical protein
MNAYMELTCTPRFIFYEPLHRLSYFFLRRYLHWLQKHSDSTSIYKLNWSCQGTNYEVNYTYIGILMRKS